MTNFIALLILSLVRNGGAKGEHKVADADVLIHRLLGYWLVSDAIELAAVHAVDEDRWGWEIAVGPKGFTQNTRALAEGVCFSMSGVEPELRELINSYLHDDKSSTLVVTVKELEEAHEIQKDTQIDEHLKGVLVDDLQRRIDLLT